MRTTMDFLQIGRKACLDWVSELPGTLDDGEIKAALKAADLLFEVSATLPATVAARLYYYDRAIEKVAAEEALDKSSPSSKNPT